MSNQPVLQFNSCLQHTSRRRSCWKLCDRYCSNKHTHSWCKRKRWCSQREWRSRAPRWTGGPQDRRERRAEVDRRSQRPLGEKSIDTMSHEGHKSNILLPFRSALPGVCQCLLIICMSPRSVHLSHSAGDTRFSRGSKP